MSRQSSGFRFDRRLFLTGVAATGVLAACGGSDDDGEATEGTQPGGGEYIIVQRVPDGILVPGPVRYPIQLSRNAEFVNDGPEQLVAQLADIDGNLLGQEVTARRRDVTPAAYYDFRFDAEEPGIYRLLIPEGPDGGVVLQVFLREQVAIASPGDPLPGFDTPTLDDARGVEPICTNDPQCEFHSVTLNEALSTGRSVAYLLGTPAFCSTGTCIPALDAMVQVMPDFADSAVAVHAEVYGDTTATTLSPAMAASGLTFEPSVFITRPDGVVSERLDGIWGAEEFREAMERATA